jgi:N-acetylmuramoyl-L-alanine amidase
MSRVYADDIAGVQNIYAEARGEPFNGQIAVGEVTRNLSKKLGRPVADIVWRGTRFSWTLAHDPNRIEAILLDDETPEGESAKEAWLQSETSNLTNGATNYFNPDTVTPSWATTMEFVVQIGHHRFYK